MRRSWQPQPKGLQGGPSSVSLGERVGDYLFDLRHFLVDLLLVIGLYLAYRWR